MSVVKRLRIPGVRQMYGWSGSASDTTIGATLFLVWRWLHDFFNYSFLEGDVAVASLSSLDEQVPTQLC